MPLVLATREGVALRCALCHDALSGCSVTCPCCATRVHRDCARGLSRCPTLGCDAPAPGPALRPGLGGRWAFLVSLDVVGLAALGVFLGGGWPVIALAALVQLVALPYVFARARHEDAAATLLSVLSGHIVFGPLALVALVVLTVAAAGYFGYELSAWLPPFVLLSIVEPALVASVVSPD